MLNGYRRLILNIALCTSAVIFFSCKDSKPIPFKKNVLPLVIVHSPNLSPYMRQVARMFSDSPQSTLADGSKVELNLIMESALGASSKISSGRLKVHGWLAPSTSLINYTNSGLTNLGPRQTDCIQLFATPIVIATTKRNLPRFKQESQEFSLEKVLTNPEGIQESKRNKLYFNHPSPLASETGLSTLIQLTYMALETPINLDKANIQSPTSLQKLEEIEQQATGYGYSDKPLLSQVAWARNDKVHFTITSEQEVAVYNLNRVKQGLEPLQALYPKEGSVWIDFNMCISEADWLSPAHKKAMQNFSTFLTTPPAQQVAVSMGFRPSAGSVPLVPPLTSEYGIDINKGKKALIPASGEVVSALIEHWPEFLKPAAIVFVMDTSGSMEGPSLRLGKTHFRNSIAATSWRDKKALMTFASNVKVDSGFVTESGELIQILDKLQAQGGSAVYDAIVKAANIMQQDDLSSYRKTILAYTDGGDKNSDTPLKRLVDMSKDTFNRHNINLIIIAVGHEGDYNDLSQIAEAANGIFVHAGYDDLSEVFAKIRGIL